MSQALPTSPDAPYDGHGRAIAMLNYGLLFVSIFFAGIPALIAVALAYTHKSRAAPALRRHFRTHIRIFWLAFFIALLAGGCAMAGLVLSVIELARGAGASWSWDGVDLRSMHVGADIVFLLVAAIILSLVDAAWLMISSAIGFIRLASDRSLGKSAA